MDKRIDAKIQKLIGHLRTTAEETFAALGYTKEEWSEVNAEEPRSLGLSMIEGNKTLIYESHAVEHHGAIHCQYSVRDSLRHVETPMNARSWIKDNSLWVSFEEEQLGPSGDFADFIERVGRVIEAGFVKILMDR